MLFPEAGRSRNPFARTAEDQSRIADFTHEILPLYLRVLATVKPNDWSALLQTLQRQAKVVERAALWSMQALFPSDPVFVGPIVAADVIAAGFVAADERFKRLVQSLGDESAGSFKLPEFTWGPGVEKMVQWAKTVKMVKRPKWRSRLQSAADDKKSTSSSGSGGSAKSKWYYAVARGYKVGVFDKWFGE